MHRTKSIEILSKLYVGLYQQQPAKIVELPGSGSDRVYFRLTGNDLSVLGAFNANTKENEAFFSFTKSFVQMGCNVPQLLKVAADRQHYLITDLGNETLFSHIKTRPSDPDILCEIKYALFELIKMQVNGKKHIDFSKCYPRESFDRQSIMWDLNYFKYEFLKLANVPFDEQELENDFDTLSDFLLKAPSGYFMHRDFQSRNIMMFDGRPWFIDYQGGRKGPLQYDLASLLYSPKTGLNPVQRDVLLDFYLSKFEEKEALNRDEFIHFYYGFVLIRILQALGAYGFRGLYERKTNFISSIPSAISNLNHLFINKLIPEHLPELEKIAAYLNRSEWTKQTEIPKDQLTIRVTSFSYKKEIPHDPSENGGGFVFDCRGLPNPGRLAEYRTCSGLDQNVIQYLEQFDAVDKFQQHVRSIVEISVKEYLQRKFNHLCVNFGCTGGQHRSVYHAEKLSAWLQNNYPVNVVLIHTEKDNWKNNG